MMTYAEMELAYCQQQQTMAQMITALSGLEKRVADLEAIHPNSGLEGATHAPVPPGDAVEPELPEVPESSAGVVTASFSAIDIEFTWSRSGVLKLGGDVRDGRVTVTANKARRRTLTNEGFGYVDITDEASGNTWRFTR